ncbi:MAG TPA: insulinase family protein [Candidatus Didemnitutus sp.]|nr:insulinase family protein [Candidatus Didemnitutus sp.]
MKFPFRRLAVLLLLFVLPVALAASDFAFQDSDLKVDPTVKWGRLKNGMRYALMPNHEPKGRASLRFAVAAGSLNESENQRGLAHFLEHMAFNGSTHFAPGTLIEYFQRLGMSFGGDTNAFTSFDRTVYQLELPDTKPETFQKALTLFSDYANGLLLEPASIEKERGIILAEKRDRDSIGFRQFVGEFQYLLPETRFPQRIPIGLEPVISTAQRDQFVDFYNAWYRPELITVVIVGDYDPATVEPMVKKLLGSSVARAPARPEPDLGRVEDHPGVDARLQSEPEAPDVRVAIETATPYAYEADTAENRLKYLPRSLALSMLNRRLDILQKKEGAPFLSGSIGVTEQFDFFRSASVELSCKPEQWQDALAVGEQELRRALQYGFQPAELAEAVAQERNGLEQAVRTAATRRSEHLADEIVDTVIDKNVFTQPATELALFTPALDHVTVEDCLSALRAVWNDHVGRHIFVTGNLKLDDPARRIVAAYTSSQAVTVRPSDRIDDTTFAYTDFGPAGKVASTHTVDDLGATLLVFENGVRANLKRTDFEAGRVRISVRIGGGRLELGADKPGLGFLTSLLVMPGGLGKHSSDDLARLLAGHTVSGNFGLGNDAFTWSAVTNQKDLLLQLELLCAFLTDPGFRPEGMRQIEKNIPPFYAQLAHTVEGPLQLETPRLLASGDTRLGLPRQPELMARTQAEAEAFIRPIFAHAPIEVAVVGDIDPEATIAALGRTFGALPHRDTKPDYAAARHVAFPATPLAKEFQVPTEIPKAIVQLWWPATDARDVHVARRFNVLAGVFEDRLRVRLREQMGGAYSPEVASNLSDTFTGYGFVVAEASVAPERVRAMADAIKEVAADLQKKGVTEEELVRAKQPLLTSIRESQRTNQYWLGNVLADAQEQPERLEWSRTRLSDTESITATELSKLAATYLDPARANEFISVPETAAKK